MPTRPRLLAIALLAAVCSLPLVPAAARAQATAPDDSAAEHKYPMPAADFRAHVTARIERRRARMEEHITQKQLPKDRADEARARFNAAVTQLNAKVDAVCADGTVTRDEALEVRELARSLIGHHGGGEQK